MDRPTWDTTWMSMAQVIKARGTCPRAQVGAVLVSCTNTLLAVGYNGAPRGFPHCAEAGCILEAGHCIRAVHAELNAILNATGSTGKLSMYTTHYPCTRCTAAMAQRGVSRIVYGTMYRGEDEPLTSQLAATLGIELVYYHSLYKGE